VAEIAAEPLTTGGLTAPRHGVPRVRGLPGRTAGFAFQRAAKKSCPIGSVVLLGGLSDQDVMSLPPLLMGFRLPETRKTQKSPVAFGKRQPNGPPSRSAAATRAARTHRRFRLSAGRQKIVSNQFRCSDGRPLVGRRTNDGLENFLRAELTAVTTGETKA